MDFGEAAPFNGVYASGRTGFYEHNPILFATTRQSPRSRARSTTKTSSGPGALGREPALSAALGRRLHDLRHRHGVDLRGGLSFGLSGFTFWSHDIGGFMGKTTEDLYARWLPFGLLTSHSRSHGFPPREPWEFGEAFTDAFRRA